MVGSATGSAGVPPEDAIDRDKHCPETRLVANSDTTFVTLEHLFNSQRAITGSLPRAPAKQCHDSMLV